MTVAEAPSTAPAREDAEPNPLAPILWLVEALWQYKWLVMTVIAAGIIAAAVFAGRLPNVYEANGLLEINPGQNDPILGREQTPGFVPPETVTETEVQVIRSYEVLSRVAEELDLEQTAVNPALRAEAAEDPPSRALAQAAIVQELAEGLTVTPTGRSFVVRVTYEGPDPVFAAAVANEVMRQYLAVEIAEERDDASEVIERLSDRLDDLREELDERERAVEAFRAQSRITQGAGTNVLSERLARLNEELIRAQSALAQAAASSGQRSGPSETLPEVVASPLIQELRAQAATQQRTVSELEALYRASHPRLIQARGALAAIQDTIAEETAKIATSLGTSEDVEAGRVAALEARVEGLRDEIAEQRAAEIELRRLERQVEASRRVYEAFLNRFNEVQGTAGLERPDGRIVAAAVPPASPSGPNRLLVTAGGAVLSGGLAFALVIALGLLDQRLRTRSDVARATGLNPVAILPPVPSQRQVMAGLVGRRRNQAFAEAITQLRAAVVLGARRGTGPAIVAVTAPDTGARHTSVAIALAQACAIAGDETVIVDADFGSPSVHRTLNGSNTHGLSDLVLSGGDVEAALQIDQLSGVTFMPAGRDADAVVYRNNAMGEVLDGLYQRFRVIIINLPPVPDVPDAQALAAEADVVTVIARSGTTGRSELAETVGMLRYSGPNLKVATALIRP